MAEHFMAQVLRWLADGQKVQMYEPGHHPLDDPLHQRERWVTASADAVMRSIIERSRPINHYRLAPTTFVLNGLEIELPLAADDDIGKGPWFIPSLVGEADFLTVVDPTCPTFKKALANELVYTSKIDAKKATQALRGLLRAAIGCRP